jgi:hypothetical protein
VLRAELAQPGRAGFLAGLNEDCQVEAQPAAAGVQDLVKRGQVDGVLTLVVSGSAGTIS